ncbi:MAG: ATP-dependent DNA ligase [Geminicoccaceae bacterium]
MQRFSWLYADLDRTTKTNAKVQAMVDYLRDAPARDAAWAVFFLTGQRLKRLISGKVLRDWALNATGLPEWLATDAHAAVGDSAETVSLLVDKGLVVPSGDALSLSQWMDERILPLRGQPAESQEALVTEWWSHLPRAEIFLLNKLLTGGFRVGVSKLLVARALAEVANLPRPAIIHRLMGQWQPTADWYENLLDPDTADDDRSRPYPFFLASPLEQDPAELGMIEDWLAEWKWDGIRGQLIHRGGEIFLWTRGEELVTDRYPEITTVAGKLPDGVVLDGEILAWNEEGVMPFSVLQKRIGRDKLGPKILKDAPVGFLAYDLLEEIGEDVRSLEQVERRERLEAIIKAVGKPLMMSALIDARSWEDLAAVRDESRSRRVEGLMLKRRTAAYGTGRQRGDWWKWKIDPLTLDAVMIYAQAGSGRRANLFTDYTFAVWKGEDLVPIAKAYSGLSDEEIRNLDRWIRRNTIERFGPVRSVTPHHVFELAFEGINASTRHKSGVALRFPRIARWRTDKIPADADTLDQVKALLDL